MNWSEQKDAFYRLAVEEGLASHEALGKALPLGSSVPEARLHKWLDRLLSTPKKFAEGRRYINRFKLGADPEFVFAQGVKDEYGRLVGSFTRKDAASLGLQQGPAFGADNNGRLAEIRPYPSRSAVNVVASILTTLRWMALQQKNTLDFEWHSGAFLWDDGIGGHVHFGRKRPYREREIKALDSIEATLLQLGVFPADQITRRRGGDARRQVYGMPGDFRLQQHGYEYRTYPSWLDSPELAFLTLVLSKLVVQDPELFNFKFGDPSFCLQRLKNFLSYFKCVDDDARLALMLLGRGLPKHIGGDFRPRWGINPKEIPSKFTKVGVMPLSIKPDVGSIGEVFDSLMLGVPLRFRVPEFTWEPVNPPKGYRMCIDSAKTVSVKGLGEMIWDLCTSEKLLLQLAGSGKDPDAIYISPWLAGRLDPSWRNAKPSIRSGNAGDGGKAVYITQNWREGSKARELKKLLTSGLFPIWRVGDVKENSYEEWLKRCPPVRTPKSKYVGDVVFESNSAERYLKG